MKRRARFIKVTTARCPRCGGGSFRIPYTELAWEEAAVVDGKLTPGEDGHDLAEHIADLAHAFCDSHGCGQGVNLTALTDEYFR